MLSSMRNALPFGLAFALVGCGNTATHSSSGTSLGSSSSSTSASGSASSSASSSSSTSSASSSSGSLACHQTSTSTLPGASIAFTGATCTFTLAQAKAGIQIPYVVSIVADIPGVTPTAQDWGNCDVPGPSGLTTFERLAGAGQNYCLCDVGFCPPGSPQVTLKTGMYPGAFSWSGQNFSGPSDTGNKPGAYFPPGDYTLTVSAKGTVASDGGTAPFTVSADFTVHLIP
jgi:hypothetical protein